MTRKKYIGKMLHLMDEIARVARENNTDPELIKTMYKKGVRNVTHGPEKSYAESWEEIVRMTAYLYNIK